MKRMLLSAALIAGLSLPALAYKDKTVLDQAMKATEQSTLVTAVKAAGLVDALSGEGPFTIFAPTNAAFGKLPEGTVDGLLKPESKDALTGILTYHVVPGDVMAKDLVAEINNNNGTFEAKTLQGATLTFTLDGDAVMIRDAKGGMAKVVKADIDGTNGVIHEIDSVLMPN